MLGSLSVRRRAFEREERLRGLRRQRQVERERKRSEYASAVMSGDAERYRERLEEWRHAEPQLALFHWEIQLRPVARVSP